MKGNRLLVKNEWFTVLDSVIVVDNYGRSITNYLCQGEKDQIVLINPSDIELVNG
jgi:hypothetical protein